MYEMIDSINDSEFKLEFPPGDKILKKQLSVWE